MAHPCLAPWRGGMAIRRPASHARLEALPDAVGRPRCSVRTYMGLPPRTVHECAWHGMPCRTMPCHGIHHAFAVPLFAWFAGAHGHSHQAARGDQPQHDRSHVSWTEAAAAAGKARHGMACRGTAAPCCGMAWRCTARHGTAWALPARVPQRQWLAWPALSIIPVLLPPRPPQVRLLGAVHALCVGHPAAQLPALRLPLLQRVSAAPACMIKCEGTTAPAAHAWLQHGAAAAAMAALALLATWQLCSGAACAAARRALRPGGHACVD